MSELPKCPLCGAKPIEGERDEYEAYSCSDLKCAMAFAWFMPGEWRRLAAPPLPPEVVAVLEALDAEMTNTDRKKDMAFEHETEGAYVKWDDAGRPGLERP